MNEEELEQLEKEINELTPVVTEAYKKYKEIDSILKAKNKTFMDYWLRKIEQERKNK